MHCYGKCLISLLLVVLMVFSIMPISAFAADLDTDTYYDFCVGEGEWINFAAWYKAQTIAEEEPIVELATVEEEAVVLDAAKADSWYWDGTTVTVTAAPNDASGVYSYYLESITINGTKISANTFTINGTDANVVVSFGRSEPEVNSNPTLEINGYHTTTDYCARFTDIKKNILTTALKNSYNNKVYANTPYVRAV